MGSFGRNFRRERELRGISLEEISQHTKIGTRILEAIENDRYDLLPGGVFNRSFVLACARYLGLDEAQIGAEFDLLVGTPKPLDVRQVAKQYKERSVALRRAAESESPGAGRRRVARIAVLSALLLGLGAWAALGWMPGGFADWWWPGRAGASGPAPSAASSVPPDLLSPAAASSVPGNLALPDGAPAASGAAQNASGAASASSTDGRLRLQVDTMHVSWVAAHADGRKVWEAVMRSGETRTVAAGTSIELRVSNAGAVVLTLNGETQPPLGRKGEAKTVTFTPQDLNRQ